MSPPRRHIPLRSCVVCRNKRPKAELIRIVATPLGSVEVDLTGKGQGRGAYVCGDTGCAQGSLRRNRIEYALRRRMTDEDWLKVLSSTEAIGSETAPGAIAGAS